jgi:hypothetical protein
MANRPYKPIDVDQVFDDRAVCELAEIAKIPSITGRGILKREIQRAARLYLRDKQSPNVNAVYREIDSLHRAAEKRECEVVSQKFAELSPPARDLLELNATEELPSQSDFVALSDQERDEVCDKIAARCRVGGGIVKGRKRQSGRRSLTWKAQLYAPKPTPHFEKRKAELEFVIWLRAAWFDAKGKLPSSTANHESPGPFVRFVKECLKLVGAGHADAIGLINEANRRGREPRPVR